MNMPASAIICQQFTENNTALFKCFSFGMNIFGVSNCHENKIFHVISWKKAIKLEAAKFTPFCKKIKPCIPQSEPNWSLCCTPPQHKQPHLLTAGTKYKTLTGLCTYNIKLTALLHFFSAMQSWKYLIPASWFLPPQVAALDNHLLGSANPT
jgi:hypothetical protein